MNPARPAEQRTESEKLYRDGLKYRAIAERVGIPIGTLATWMAAGIRAGRVMRRHRYTAWPEGEVNG